MKRHLSLLVFLFACQNENTFGDDLPEPPVTNIVDPENAKHTDAIVQVTTPMVDVLWTIDNSGSMGNEQAQLAENFPAFMDYFEGSGLDFHVGVITTDMQNPNQSGKLQPALGYKYIDTDTPSPIEVFQQMAMLGTNGSGDEAGIGTTFLALEQHADTFNAGFQREEASINTIVISDERDHTSPSFITQPEFVDWYDSLKRETDMRSFSCIATLSGYDRGTAYINTANEIGGIVWDITAEDWTEVLELLGIQASGLKREYFLSQRPVPESIEVKVLDALTGAEVNFDPAVYDDGGNVIDGEYTYDGIRNSVAFLTFVPAPLSTILVEYTLESSLQDVEETVE